MTKYNGHKNWNHWHVSLWMNNDEGLYALAVDTIRYHRRKYGNKAGAAREILEALHAAGIEKTPDGAPYTVTAIKAAIVEL